jgi:hypothetical protein
MGKTFNYNFIKEEFRKNELELLENKYKDNNTPMLCKDKNGYLGYIKYANLQFGKKFKPFSKRNPMGLENVKLFFLKNNIKCVVLFNKMPNSKDRVKFKCGCGNIFYYDLGHILNRGFCRCPDCALKIRSNKKKIPKDTVEKYLFKNGYKMLQNFYENNCSNIKVEDLDGYKGFVTYNGLLSGKQMSRFNLQINEKYFIYNLNIFCKNNNIKSKAKKIFFKTKNANTTIVEFVCECGESFYSTQSRFIFAGKNKCDVCSGRMSSYEIKIMNWLNKHEIEYIYQKRYDDCKNKNSLPFDFYLEKFNILIEVDGEGHFFPVRYNGIHEEIAKLNFIRTQKNDLIKNKYCEKNNIKLIRISYDKFKEKKYIKILKDNLLK